MATYKNTLLHLALFCGILATVQCMSVQPRIFDDIDAERQKRTFDLGLFDHRAAPYWRMPVLTRPSYVSDFRDDEQYEGLKKRIGSLERSQRRIVNFLRKLAEQSRNRAQLVTGWEGVPDPKSEPGIFVRVLDQPESGTPCSGWIRLVLSSKPSPRRTATATQTTSRTIDVTPKAPVCITTPLPAQTQVEHTATTEQVLVEQTNPPVITTPEVPVESIPTTQAPRVEPEERAKVTTTLAPPETTAEPPKTTTAEVVISTTVQPLETEKPSTIEEDAPITVTPPPPAVDIQPEVLSELVTVVEELKKGGEVVQSENSETVVFDDLNASSEAVSPFDDSIDSNDVTV